MEGYIQRRGPSILEGPIETRELAFFYGANILTLRILSSGAMRLTNDLMLGDFGLGEGDSIGEFRAMVNEACDEAEARKAAQK